MGSSSEDEYYEANSINRQSDDIIVQYEQSFHDQEVYAKARILYIDARTKLLFERTEFIAMSSDLLTQDKYYIDSIDNTMCKDHKTKINNYNVSRNLFISYFEKYNKTINDYENLKKKFSDAQIVFVKKRSRYDEVWLANHVTIKPKRPLWPLCKFITSNGEPFSIFKGIYHLSDLTESQENRKIQIPINLLNNNKTEKNMFVVNNVVFPSLIDAAEDIIKISLVNTDIPVVINIFKIPDYIEQVFPPTYYKYQKDINAFNKKRTLLCTNPEWKKYITDLKSYNYTTSDVYINNFLKNYKKLYDEANYDQVGIMFIDDFDKYSYHDDNDDE